MIDLDSTNKFHLCLEPYHHHRTQSQTWRVAIAPTQQVPEMQFCFCVSTIKNALFQQFLSQICRLGSVVRALHYATGRLPVLIQAVCFCPSGNSAPTLFKSLESKPTISNKQNTSHRTSLQEAQPLLQLVCANESSFRKAI